MKVYFWASKNKRVLRSRRGKRTYRQIDIPENVDVCEYTPLANSVIELVENNHVVGTGVISTVAPTKITLQSTGDIEAVHVESEAKESTPPEVVNELEEEAGNSMQSVGGESSDNAPTISGSAEVQVSSVVSGDDELDSADQCGPESGSDGVYCDDDGMDVSQDRYGEEIDSVSPADEDAGRD